MLHVGCFYGRQPTAMVYHAWVKDKGAMEDCRYGMDKESMVELTNLRTRLSSSHPVQQGGLCGP